MEYGDEAPEYGPVVRQYDLIKTRVHALLDAPNLQNRPVLVVQIFFALAILTNTCAIVLYTVPSIGGRYGSILDPVIGVCLIIFTLEYLLRLWSCTIARDLKGMILDRIRYALRLFQLVDLISIMPALFPFFFPRHLALLRTFLIVSIFKMGRYAHYSSSLDQLKRVLLRKREIFGIMIFFLIFVVLFSSTIVYLVENPAQPDKFSSIPAAMWWAMMTVTTVGYGDIYPVTLFGKIIGSLMTLVGVLVLALPSAILATGFIEEREKERSTVQNTDLTQVHRDLTQRFSDLHGRGSLSDEELEECRLLIGALRPKKE
ncbi:MAG TPA: ion transporter [Methanospirillum sp.]|nr:ion transporter [Methanospirillum sp.]